MRTAVAWIFLLLAFPCVARAQAPVVELVPQESWIHFHVKASTTISGKFDKWDGKLTFTSPDETTGILEVKIQADSVDTGSGMKNGKLKSKDFFDVQENPEITFVSKKIAKTGANVYEVDGDFTSHGVSNPEKLTLTVSNKGGGTGEIRGTMVFNRKDYGMNKGIPFIKIADHVDVTFHFRVRHVSGPPLAITH